MASGDAGGEERARETRGGEGEEGAGKARSDPLETEESREGSKKVIEKLKERPWETQK